MNTSTEVTPVRGDVAVIALIGCVHAVSHFFHLVIPLLFPWLMPAFDLSFTQAGALMTVFFAISGVGQALAGLAVDRIGAKPVLYCGVLLLALSGVLLGVAQNYPMLMLAAAAAGAGNSVFHPVDFTILNRRISKSRLGHAFSAHGLSGNLGWAAAPLLMIAVASFADWRSVAFVAAALAVASLALIYFFQAALGDLPEHLESEKHVAAGSPVSTLTILRSPAVLFGFVFFFLITVAFGALQNFSPAALKAMYGLSLGVSASCLSGYLLGGAGGIVVGGFVANWRAQDQILAMCLAFGALISLLVASAVVADWAVLPLLTIMGFGVGIAGPSRDLLVRKAAMQGLNQASFGRVYGFVYSGLDLGIAAAPLIFGPIMDGGRFGALWVGIALFQGLAVVSALYVGVVSEKGNKAG